jgi:hypothetical protein
LVPINVAALRYVVPASRKSSIYARRHFAEPSRALGHVIRVFDRPMTVVAVLPQAFDFPDGTDIWFPATAIASPSVTNRSAKNKDPTILEKCGGVIDPRRDVVAGKRPRAGRRIEYFTTAAADLPAPPVTRMRPSSSSAVLVAAA